MPINYATAGPASSSRLSVELFKATARLDATQVHYKGGVPAVSEFYPQFEAQSWVGLLAPAATPRNIVRRLNAELIRVLGLPEARERFLSQGYETVGGTPEQVGDWIRAESAKWGKMIRDQSITAE